MTGPRASGRLRAARGGFTLIELMIVIAIIAIIAAIAVPNLLAARMRANESAAISVLRNVSTSQAQFQRAGRADEDGDGCGEYGYFGELTGVVPVRGTSYTVAQLTRSMSIVDVNGEVQRSGYIFRMYLPAVGGDGVRELPGGGQAPGALDPEAAEVTWVLYAWPSKFDSTGLRTFCISHRGDSLWTEAPVYDRPNCPLTAGAALITTNPNDCVSLPAVGTTGQDGNPWRQVQ